MNRRSGVIVVLALVILAGLLWVRTAPLRSTATDLPTGIGTLTMIWVIDGDTFDGTGIDGRTVRVRILGIDAPEIAHDGSPEGCGGNAAKQALIRMLGDRKASVRSEDLAGATDRYGRLLAYVATAEFDDVGLQLVREGLVEAWHPASEPAPVRYPSYVVAQVKARAAGKGSWPTCGTLGR